MKVVYLKTELSLSTARKGKREGNKAYVLGDEFWYEAEELESSYVDMCRVWLCFSHGWVLLESTSLRYM